MLKKSHSIILLGFLLALITYYMVGHSSDFKLILNISPAYCFIIGMLYILFLITNGLFFKIMVSEFDIDMSFCEYTAISILTAFGNAFVPLRGGVGMRAIYMKSRYGFNYTNSVATIAGTYVIGLNVTSIVALVTIVVLYVKEGQSSPAITSAIAFMALASGYIMLFNPQWHKLIPFSGIRSKLDELMYGWSVIRKSSKNVLYMYALTLSNFILLSVITWCELKALGIGDMHGNPVTYLQALFLSVISIISLFVSITPASLGIKEGLLMLTSSVVNISPSYVVMMSILDRAISFSVLLMLFHPATYCLNVCLRKKAPAEGN
ncbi:MAG: lysylphosphatidylglycerol synthase transmembrane domain-containing protein [Syntrophobacteraceae bacterium]